MVAQLTTLAASSRHGAAQVGTAATASEQGFPPQVVGAVVMGPGFGCAAALSPARASSARNSIEILIAQDRVGCRDVGRMSAVPYFLA